MAEQKIGVAIIGARAFTSGELLRILLRHPGAEVVALQARVDAPMEVGEVFGFLRGAPLPAIQGVDVDHLPENTVSAFLCLPHTVGAKFAPLLLERGIRVFDLSADFRFRDHRIYENTYAVQHPSPDLNRRAIYGLPELFRANIIGQDLVACPGCYPTSIILGLAPLMKQDMVVKGTIIADSKSGVSGAGRTPNETTHYCNANENFAAYKIASHRHQPEIEENLTRLSGERQTLTFVPHLVPMERGILSTIYASLKEDITEDRIHALYSQFYDKEPFVRVLPKGALPATANVARTNVCEIQVRVDAPARRVIIVSAIDNLVKGASGQAVQCFNVSHGLDETAGL
ncbi:MAG: N-acetyl-gamma-glutamyl-phosphate reductase [Candidatus Sumerlaeota bacterium]|nr:N-acetyl-gamma-glutamyl-phosphate reductase [Candidatus Sumerlaeota bacterium]